MAKHKLTPEMEVKKFKKGQSGNPLGGQLHNKELKAIRNLTEDEMIEIGSLVVKGSIDELKRIKDDPKTTVLKAMMASVAIKTIAKGDAQALEVLLNRLVGKVKDKVEVTSTNINHNNVNAQIAVLTDADLKTRLKKIRSDV